MSPSHSNSSSPPPRGDNGCKNIFPPESTIYADPPAPAVYHPLTVDAGKVLMSASDNSGNDKPRATGPRTAAGKARSSLNALKHGRTAVKHPALLPIDDDEAFRGILRDHLAHFAPASPVESRIVQLLAHTEWSIFRLQAVEAAFLDRIYQNHDPARWGQAPVTSPPTRLGIALENSINASGMAHYLSNRLSRLTIDRNRLIQTLRSSRRLASSGQKSEFVENAPSESTQAIDSNDEQPA